MDNSALEGLTVCDFTHAVAGPFCTRLLAEMGALVIKIESNESPIRSRYIGPFPKESGVGLNRSGHFNGWNRNKFGVTINLKKPEGIQLAKELIKKSDVAINNFTTGAMERLGLDYPTLREIKPDIIYVSSTGFGKTGPESSYIAYATLIDATSGGASMTGYLSDNLPRSSGTLYCDIIAGVHLAFAILAALHHRQNTGEGQEIELAMREASMTFFAEGAMEYSINNRLRPIMENHDDIMAPHNCYRCRGEDKWVAIAVSSEEEWAALCRAMGNPAWVTRKEFGDELSRWKNQDELDRLIGQWTINHTAKQVMDVLQGAGVTAGASYNGEELFNDPHFRSRGFWAKVDHPETGEEIHFGKIWKLSDTPGKVPCAAPMLGQHNEYICGEIIGLNKKEIARLVERQVIY